MGWLGESIRDAADRYDYRAYIDAGDGDTSQSISAIIDALHRWTVRPVSSRSASHEWAFTLLLPLAVVFSIGIGCSTEERSASDDPIDLAGGSTPVLVPADVSKGDLDLRIDGRGFTLIYAREGTLYTLLGMDGESFSQHEVVTKGFEVAVRGNVGTQSHCNEQVQAVSEDAAVGHPEVVGNNLVVWQEGGTIYQLFASSTASCGPGSAGARKVLSEAESLVPGA